MSVTLKKNFIKALVAMHVLLSVAHAEKTLQATPYSEPEKNYAESLSELYRVLKAKNKIDIVAYKKLNTHIKKAPMFDEIHGEVINTYNVINNNKLIPFCEQNDKKFDQSVTILISSIKNSYCEANLLNYIVAKKTSKGELTKNSELVVDSFRHHLKKGKFVALNKTLSFYKNKDKQSYDFLRKLLTDSLISTNAEPSDDIKSHIYFNQQYIKHVSENKSETDGSKRHFLNEFKAIIDKFITNLNSGHDVLAQDYFNKAISFYKNNKIYIPQSDVWDVFNRTGKLMLKSDQKDLAYLFFNHSLEIADQEQYAETYFQIIWSSISKGDIATTMKLISELNLIDKFNDIGSKARFWVSYTIEMNGDPSKAYHLYKKQIEMSPLSYYSILSLKQVFKMSKEIYFPLPIGSDQSEFKDDHKQTASIHLQDYLKRIKLWSNVSNKKFLDTEIDDLLSINTSRLFKNRTISSESQSQNQRLMITKVSEVLSQHGEFLSLFRLVNNSLNNNLISLNTDFLKQLFPFLYVDEVKGLSQGIDPLVVLALIRQESAFNPNATSIVGAKGLMQLMPATARQFKRNLNNKHLAKPELNLMIGTQYFRKLLSKYDGDLVSTLAAYNAGEGNLAKWKRNILLHDDPLKNIESIPFKETREYVKLIYRNVFFYKYLANDLSPEFLAQENFRLAME